MQKLTYFVKVLGVPVPYRFGIYTYGPYSDQVTFSVESLLADDVIEDRSKKQKFSNYMPGQNSKELLSLFADNLHPYEDKINRVVKALGKFSPNQLELISTLHFIAKRQKQIGGEASKESVVRDFKAIKGEKFRESHVIACFHALDTTGLI